MLELFTDPQNWVALLTLTGLEIVLGIDNVIFIAIVTARLPKAQQGLAYRLGLGGAMITRVLLLLALSWVMSLTKPWFTFAGVEISGRDFIVITGGLFLIGKSAQEIYMKVELHDDEATRTGKTASLWGSIVQIMILDIVFSLDSVITAVGMAKHVEIMIAAIIVSVVIMLVFAQKVGEFVNANPSVKILALSFLMLIGTLLLAEGFDQHINKGYVYFAMAYAIAVEMFNLRRRKNIVRKTLPPPAAPPV